MDIHNIPAFDTAIQAYCGLMTHQGGAGEPALVRTYIADKTASTFAVQGVLAAPLFLMRGRSPD